MTFQSKQAEVGLTRRLSDGFLSGASWGGALLRVWLLAAALFLASGVFFLLMTGVVKMLVPLALLAVGLGTIGSIQVLAKMEIKRRGGG